MLLALIRLFTSVVASLGGVLVTAVLWKPGVFVAAVLVPVIALFVEQALGEPIKRRLARDHQDEHGLGRPNARAALTVGLIGFLIVAAALTAPKLVSGEPLDETPLFGGDVPLVQDENGAGDEPDGAADGDGDGVADADDNCPTVANSGQADTNNAGRGDACDPDDDNDTVLDGDDNCPTVANSAQENTNNAGRGDACDDDDDNDTILDADDNCRTTENPLQENADEDEQGDACDDDDDDDGTPDDTDPAPLDPSVAA